MSNCKITIGIDASRSIDSIQKTGVELVSDNLLKNIVEMRRGASLPNVDLVFYTPKEISWLSKENQKILKWPFKWLWTQIRLAWELLIYPPDKLFIPVHKVPFICYLINLLSCYVLIHDIAFLKYPELYSPFQRWYLKFDLKRCLKKCTKIFVPTEQVKNDLLKYTAVDVDKVVVVHHGYKTINNKQLTINNRKKQILYIGRIEEKKNISNLIKAFEIFNQKYSEYKLILAGKIDKKYLNTLNSTFQIPDSVEILGYISEEKKKELLQESQCLVLISKEEGFGFPILEAWDYQLPVLASNIPVLQEIGGNACWYVNPDSVVEITHGLNKITQDKNLQNDLIEKGSERLKNFNWQKTAEKYLQEILK